MGNEGLEGECGIVTFVELETGVGIDGAMASKTTMLSFGVREVICSQRTFLSFRCSP